MDSSRDKTRLKARQTIRPNKIAERIFTFDTGTSNDDDISGLTDLAGTWDQLLYSTWNAESNIYRLDINEIQEQSKQNTMSKYGTRSTQVTKYEMLKIEIPIGFCGFILCISQNIPKFDDESKQIYKQVQGNISWISDQTQLMQSCIQYLFKELTRFEGDSFHWKVQFATKRFIILKLLGRLKPFVSSAMWCWIYEFS